MTKITLEFDVDHLPVYYESDTGYTETPTIESAIISGAADMLQKRIDRKAQDAIVELVQERVLEAIEARVSEIIDAALEQQLQPTNEWGEAKGNPRTIREIILSEAEGYLTQKVDHEGKPESSTYRKSSTRLEFLTRGYIRKEYAETLNQEVERVIGEIKAGINDRTEQAIKKGVQQLIGVNLD
jgi:hypothetical protein